MHASNTIVQVDAYWLRIYALDFFAAYQNFKAPDNRYSPVPYFLICRSIELSLKSFLFTVGYKKSNRKTLAHNLIKALEKARHEGLDNYLAISTEVLEALGQANSLYSKKEFEYFESLETIYDPHNFDILLLASFAERLLDAIEVPVSNSIFVN